MNATTQKSAFSLSLGVALRDSSIRQSELARAVDCTPQYISQLISGERPPSRDIVEKIARVLKVAPHDLDVQYRKQQRQHFEMMQGIEIGYLGAAMNALRGARTSLLAQAPPASLKAGAGKADAKLFDAVTEQAIAGELQAYNSRCVIITEETGIIGDRKHAASVSYVIDPFDRSRPFFREVTGLFKPENHRTLRDIVSDQNFRMRSLEAPTGSITCVRDGEIVFNAMIDYASGRVYVACKGFIGYGDIDACLDPHTLVEKGTEITFSPRMGPRYLCFIGDQDKDKELAIGERSSKYKEILMGLGFELEMHLGADIENPGGPARILYLSDMNNDADNPIFILSNGEKIFEFLGWLAYAIHGGELAVYELYSEGFEARGLILHSPPPNYSAFSSTGTGFRLDIDKVIDIDLQHPGHYRGAIAVTHARSTVACAFLRGKPNSRQLYHPIARN